MGVLRVERVSGWSGVRVTFPIGEGVAPSEYFGALVSGYAQGTEAGFAEAGAWVADVALHADLIAKPQRLGIADGAVTIADRTVPLRVGTSLPAGLVRPVTAARLRVLDELEGRALRELATITTSEAREWPAPAGDGAAAVMEGERRGYFFALCRCIREATYDVVMAVAPAAERAGGVPLGPLVGGPVLLVAAGASTFYGLAKDRDGFFASPLARRQRREKIAAAARAYVARLAAYEAGGRRELPAAGDVERAAAEDVADAAESEAELWGAVATPAPPASGASGFKLGTVGKLAVGLFVVKTVLGD